MLSYQHGYHAGNRADVLKHAVLDCLLSQTAALPGGYLYVETHSGRGRYDLGSDQATKSGEAEDGIVALLRGKPPKPLRNWMSLVEARGVHDYPGSPALALHHLPQSARVVLFEKHPAEYAALMKACGDDKRVQIKPSDGYSGALKLAPRAGEQLTVFIDPSFETSRDIDALALWAPKALKRWPSAVLIFWLPLFRDGREAEFGEYVASLDASIVAGARWPVESDSETALEGSAIIALRASPDLAAPCHAIASALQFWWSAQA